ncbi:hypothetical protein WJX72_010547 [[Myrmecia] bisecta]|uniref:Metallo-beta-lactamase domain-containing protein n=1 Tax=[Myrmecia] bisecta TaxID=41462 RepID=A0AAW1R9I4_9CHLO
MSSDSSSGVPLLYIYHPFEDRVPSAMPKIRSTGTPLGELKRTGDYQHVRISDTTYRVAELDDPYRQYCQCYVRLAKDRCILIDTGCGLGDLRGYIDEHINTEKLPYMVICTHAHFDHVAGNHTFEDVGVCFAGADPEWTMKVIGFKMRTLDNETLDVIKPFRVSRWLQDGELIALDGSEPAKPEASLHVRWTPGHSPDSVSLYDPQEHRLYVGDFLYPYASWDDPLSPPGGLWASFQGSDLPTYVDSLKKVQAFLAELKSKHGTEVTLACGHNSYKEDSSLVDSALQLILDVQAGKLPYTPHEVFELKMWEYISAVDPRAGLLLPADGHAPY